jgi:hypothetical protein
MKFACLPVRYVTITPVALLLAAMLVLVGCGVSQTPPAGDVTAPPTIPTTHTTPTTGLPTPGKGTPTMTNVTVVTDQQSYQSGAVIHVTITNHLSKPVFTSNGKLNCTMVEAQMKTTQGWQKATIAPCADADMRDIIEIAPGATRSVTLATTPTTAGAAFTPGTYRLALSYSTYTIPPQLSAPFNGGFGNGGQGGQGRPLAHATSSPLETVYSPAFTIA